MGSTPESKPTNSLRTGGELCHHYRLWLALRGGSVTINSPVSPLYVRVCGRSTAAGSPSSDAARPSKAPYTVQSLPPHKALRAAAPLAADRVRPGSLRTRKSAAPSIRRTREKAPSYRRPGRTRYSDCACETVATRYFVAVLTACERVRFCCIPDTCKPDYRFHSIRLVPFRCNQCMNSKPPLTHRQENSYVP